MKKLFVIARTALGVLACLTTFNAFASTKIEAQLGEEIILNNSTYAVYTPSTDGVLTAVINSAGANKGIYQLSASTNYSILYSNIAEESTPSFVPADKVACTYEKDGSYIIKEIWEVTGNKEYYIFYSGDLNITLSFEGGEISDPKAGAVEIKIPGTTQLGGDNPIGRLEVSEAGILTVVASQNPYSVNAATGVFLKDAEDNSVLATTGGGFNGWLRNDENDSYTATFNLEEGTYYVYYQQENTNLFDFSFQPLSDVDVTLTNISWAPGTILDTTQQALANGITFTFSPSETEIGSAELQYVSGGEEKTLSLNVENNKGIWNIGGSSEIYDAVDEMDKGSEAKIVLSNVAWDGKNVSSSDVDSEYVVIGEDGTITVTYLAPGDAFVIESEEWPSALTPFMLPSNENGYATLTFNYPVKQLGAELLFYANYQLGSQVDVPCQYSVPVTIDGNTATLNFTNVDFTTLEGYSSFSGSSVSIVIQGTYAENGAKLASFVKYLPYNRDGADTPLTEMSDSAEMIAPANLAVLYPQNLEITWDYAEISIIGDNAFAWVKVGEAGAAQQCEVNAITVTDENGVTPEYYNALEIVLPAALASKTGQFIFTLPANTVQNLAGEVNKEQEFYYTVASLDNAYTLVNIEENGSYKASDLDEVAIVWQYLTDDQLVEGFVSDPITVTPEEGEAIEVAPILVDNAIQMDLSDLEEGVYVLNVPAGYVWVGMSVNPNIVINFTVEDSTGVNALEKDLNTNDVYNLQGVKVNSNNLVPGNIYIINGKKVLVK